MAKLKHLAKLIEKMNGSDASRTNSLIMVARKSGLFTTGGRGNNAPDMHPSDFGRALLLGATLEPPTRAAEAIRKLDRAAPFVVKIDPSDGGGFRERVPEDLSDIPNPFDYYGFPYLPSFLSVLPTDLSGFLEKLFVAILAGEWTFQNWDRFSLRDEDGRYEASFLIHGSRYSEIAVTCHGEVPDEMRAADDYAWEFIYRVRNPKQDHEIFGATDRLIYSPALFAFQELATKETTD